ncbi:hypothetical protein [Desulfovibrio sp. 1188_IL3213]|uniref:hypothetical protein n=1 Tax=Desulfovibrio sp. 1188_IL3213 TaxID=3084052 RepID=UPI002FD978AC
MGVKFLGWLCPFGRPVFGADGPEVRLSGDTLPLRLKTDAALCGFLKKSAQGR